MKWLVKKSKHENVHYWLEELRRKNYYRKIKIINISDPQEIYYFIGLWKTDNLLSQKSHMWPSEESTRHHHTDQVRGNRRIRNQSDEPSVAPDPQFHAHPTYNPVFSWWEPSFYVPQRTQEAAPQQISLHSSNWWSSLRIPIPEHHHCTGFSPEVHARFGRRTHRNVQ